MQAAAWLPNVYLDLSLWQKPYRKMREGEFQKWLRHLTDMVGADNVQDFEPTMGAEDFSYFLLEKPGCYFLIGNGDGAHREGGHGMGPCMLHNPSYDFNDDLIPLGGTLWVNMAEQWLNTALTR